MARTHWLHSLEISRAERSSSSVALSCAASVATCLRSCCTSAPSGDVSAKKLPEAEPVIACDWHPMIACDCL